MEIIQKKMLEYNKLGGEIEFNNLLSTIQALEVEIEDNPNHAISNDPLEGFELEIKFDDVLNDIEGELQI